MHRAPLALVALLLLHAPALALANAPEPVALVVAFGHAPPHLAPGDDLLGARVLRVNPTLRYAIVETDEPARFARTALAHAGVAAVAPNEAGAREDALPQVWAEQPTADFSPPVFAELPGGASPLGPNDPYYAAQYAARQVRADAVWPTQRDAPGVALCVLDSGVRATHEDLAGSRWKGGYDFVERDADPQDERYHGTFVTSLAAGAIDNGRGIAGMAQVDFYHGRVLNAAGSGKWTNIADGIQWCADLPLPRVVISMSLGGSPNEASRVVLQQAVQHAAAKGALMIASAGNANGIRPYCVDCVHYPARLPEVIAVTSTSHGEAPSWFSSVGPQAELSAPGDWVQGAVHKSDRAYTFFSGTSFSAPLVAGAAALAWSASPDLTAEELRARLVATAQDLGAPGHDIHYGHGELDVRCLLENVAPCDGRS